LLRASATAFSLLPMKIVFVVLLMLAALFKAMPDSPPDTSKTYVDGNYGISVSAEQNTYLEVESGYIDDCNSCYSMHLYYSKVGGWFQSTQRTLLLSIKNMSDSDRVQFKKINSKSLSPIEIYIASDPNKKRLYIFTPPLTFEQARFIKPTIIK
jgi:hypothetical protein